MRRKANPQQPAILARPTEVKKLLKVTEVAEVLGVSKVKVYELLKSGLPSVKFDGARRVHPDKLRDWIEQHSAEPPRQLVTHLLQSGAHVVQAKAGARGQAVERGIAARAACLEKGSQPVHDEALRKGQRLTRVCQSSACSSPRRTPA
jgi:excisionase family DNA binding protein